MPSHQTQKSHWKGLSNGRISNLIGISLDAAYELEKIGLIKADDYGSPKLGKIIVKKNAEHFYRTYIASTEIAKQRGVSANTDDQIPHPNRDKALFRPFCGWWAALFLPSGTRSFNFTTIEPWHQTKIHPQQMTLPTLAKRPER